MLYSSWLWFNNHTICNYRESNIGRCGLSCHVVYNTTLSFFLFFLCSSASSFPFFVWLRCVFHWDGSRAVPERFPSGSRAVLQRFSSGSRKNGGSSWLKPVSEQLQSELLHKCCFRLTQIESGAVPLVFCYPTLQQCHFIVNCIADWLTNLLSILLHIWSGMCVLTYRFAMICYADQK